MYRKQFNINTEGYHKDFLLETTNIHCHVFKPYFTVEGFDVNNGSANVVVSTGANKYSFIEVGQDVTGSGIVAGTTVTVVNNGTITLSQAANSSADPVTLTFATDDIKCNYIRKPVDVNWGYTEINGTAMTDPARGLQVFESLGQSTQSSVTIIRNGRSEILTIDTSQLSQLP